MKLLNREVPLERFEIPLPPEVLESPIARAKVVTVLRFMDRLSQEIQNFELSLPDRNTIKDKSMRVYADAEYLLIIKQQITEFIAHTENGFYAYSTRALDKIELAPSSMAALQNSLADELKNKLKNLRKL